MPRLSRFTPCGMLAMSSRPSHAETIFRSMVRSQGGAFASGGHQEAKLYAQAMGLARAQYELERAGNQQFAKKVTDFFPIQEHEHGLIPKPRDTVAARRGALAAAKLLPGGAEQTNVENALRALLGAAFVAYRPTPLSERVLWPEAIGDSPMNLQEPRVRRKRIRLLTAISTGLGAPQQVQYEETRSQGEDPTLVVNLGDSLVVEPAGTEERVTVTATAIVDTSLFFTAVFNTPHPAGALAIGAPYPRWASTKRHNLVVVTEAAALDAETRRKTNNLMHKLLRGVSTWSIAAASSGSTTGPFRVGIGRLGITTFGTITL
jgi:hypothetical protein